MGLSLQHLQRYQDEGDDMLSRIVTGDESWCTIISPRRSVPPCSGNIPRPQRARSLRWHHWPGKSCWRCSGIAKAYCSPNSSSVTTPLLLPRTARSWRNFVPPSAGSDQAFSLKGWCCCMTTPVLIMPVWPQRRWGLSSGKSSNIHLTARTSHRAISTCLALWNIFRGSAFLTMTRLKEQCRVVPTATTRILRRRFPDICETGGTSV